MNIKLTHKAKIALLEAINSGYLDTSIFDDETSAQEQTIEDIETSAQEQTIEDIETSAQEQTIEDIEREIVRIEKFEGNSYLLALSDLMKRFASNEITDEVYISERIKLRKTN